MTIKEIEKELMNLSKERLASGKIFNEMDMKTDGAYNIGYARGLLYALNLIHNSAPEKSKNIFENRQIS